VNLKLCTLDASSQLDDMHHALVQHVDSISVQASDGGASHVIDAMLGALNYVHGP